MRRPPSQPPPATKLRNDAEHRYRTFLNRLRAFTVLDPACGSGNFLYLALHALKDLEHRVQFEAESLGFQRAFPEIGPANVNGNRDQPLRGRTRPCLGLGRRDPVDAAQRLRGGSRPDPQAARHHRVSRTPSLAPDGAEPEWPAADVLIGNPPFLGNRKVRSELGSDYVDSLQSTYVESVRGIPDLVCYWFAKTGRLLASGKIKRAGLVATNSIRGGTNRLVLDRILEDSTIFDAYDDEPWVDEGAAVRVSLVCIARRDSGLPVQLNGGSAGRINADLTTGDSDLTKARSLTRNLGVAFMGDIKRGKFDIPGDLAREWPPLACQSERPTECRCAQALDQRDGPHPASFGEVDRRLRATS